MINKSFLSSVLAFVTIGVAARADVVTSYCDSGNCGANNSAAFENVVAADYTYADLTDLTFSGSLSDAGLNYLDPTTQVLFAASSSFSLSGGALMETAGNTITITVPAAYAAIRLNVSQVSGGNDTTYLDSGMNYYAVITSMSQEIGYVNTAPGSNWTITIKPSFGGEQLQVNSFDPAGMAMSDTPEVGTLLLIGSGLIAMRYMRRARWYFFRTPQTA